MYMKVMLKLNYFNVFINSYIMWILNYISIVFREFKDASIPLMWRESSKQNCKRWRNKILPKFYCKRAINKYMLKIYVFQFESAHSLPIRSILEDISPYHRTCMQIKIYIIFVINIAISAILVRIFWMSTNNVPHFSGYEDWHFSITSLKKFNHRKSEEL